MYKCEHFKIEEITHPELLSKLGATNCWMRHDRECLEDLDLIRETYDDVIYCNVGTLDSRGARPPKDPDGAFYSVHKQWKAFDLSPKDGDHDRLYQVVYDLMRNGKLKALNTIEDRRYTKTWLHVAKMNVDLKDVPFIIKP